MGEIGAGVDPLDAELNNPEAIRCMRDLYDIDEAMATELWHRFIGTVKKMRQISEDQERSAKGKTA
jgi:hypothetical protein